MQEYWIEGIVNAHNQLANQRIVVDRGLIRAIEPCKRGDAAGPAYRWAVPGFIDMHTHGGANHDVLDNSLETFAALAAHHVSHGTTSFLASVGATSLEVLERICATARAFMRNQASAQAGRARLLGLHLEGPWLSTKNAGAQNRELIVEPDEESFEFVRKNADVIRVVTFSYHSAAAQKLLALLIECGIVPACGHDEATDCDILEGFTRGIRLITHIYSNTASFQRVNGLKHLGTLEMALMTDGIAVEVIADGRHITKHFWDFITHNKSVDDIIIVSDSIRCAGLTTDSSHCYESGGQQIIVDQGVAWLPDRSTFAGSVATVHSNFRRMVRSWQVNLQDAARMTSHNAACQLCISDTAGSILPGKQADIVFLNDDLAIVAVLASGIASGPD